MDKKTLSQFILLEIVLCSRFEISGQIIYEIDYKV